MHEVHVLVNHLVKLAQEKSVFKLAERPGMTTIYWGVKEVKS